MSSKRIKIDWDKVGKFLEAGCSGSEIAGNLGIHENTLYGRCKEDLNIEFVAYRQQKRSSGDALLRVKQFENAMKGDKTMQVWLGKQRLGQKDKHEFEGDVRISPFLELMKESTQDEESDKS